MTTNDRSFNHSTAVLRPRIEKLEALNAAGGEVAQVLAEIRRFGATMSRAGCLNLTCC